jgi:hypothetical protein
MAGGRTLDPLAFSQLSHAAARANVCYPLRETNVNQVVENYCDFFPTSPGGRFGV